MRSLLVFGFLFLGLLSSACTGRGALLSTTVWAGPLLSDDRVFLGSMDGELVAVPRTGEGEVWSVATQEGRADIAAVYGTPATDGDYIYFGGFDGVLYAVDPEAADENRVAWSFDTGDTIVGGPAVADGLVFIGAESGALYALDAATGDPLWNAPFEAGGRIWASPTVAGDLVYVSSMNGSIYAVDSRTGAQEWSFSTGAPVASSPVLHEDVLFIGSFDHRFYALDAQTGREVWGAPFEAANWFWTEALVHEGTVYVGALDHNLYALDARDGTLEWSFLTDGALRAKPVLVDGAVVQGAALGTDKGAVYWVDARSGQERTPRTFMDTPVYAPLAVAEDGTIYLYPQDGRLYTLSSANHSAVSVYQPES